MCHRLVYHMYRSLMIVNNEITYKCIGIDMEKVSCLLFGCVGCAVRCSHSAICMLYQNSIALRCVGLGWVAMRCGSVRCGATGQLVSLLLNARMCFNNYFRKVLSVKSVFPCRQILVLVYVRLGASSDSTKPGFSTTTFPMLSCMNEKV